MGKDEAKARTAEKTKACSSQRFWSQESMASILALLRDAVIVVDPNGRVVTLNPAAQALSAWSEKDVRGKRLEKILEVADPVTGEPEDFALLKLVEAREPQTLSARTALIGKRGEKRPVVVEGSPMRDSRGRNLGAVLVCWGVKPETRSEEELRRLTGRLLEVQEEERRQVAYDIHDGLGQLMTAASMHLEAFAGRRRPLQPRQVESELTRARRCLNEAVVEMRRMVSDLGPLLLEGMGLVEAARRLLTETAERAGWQVELEDETCSDRLDPSAEIALFRIVQEALANAVKHAQTDRVRLSFKKSDHLISVEVRDWGKGFDEAGLRRRRQRGRPVGLLGMRERASLIGGSVHIESKPGRGTLIRATVPVAWDRKGRATRKKRAEVVKMDGRAEPKKARESRESIRVLIVDDHPMVREGLRSMLTGDVIEVVGEAASGAQGVEKVRELAPDIVLIDVRMPDMDGLAVTEIIKDVAPETIVVVITSYESKEYLKRAIEAGAAGYVLKGIARDRLIDMIRLVRDGGSLVDARLLSALLEEMGVEGSRFHGVEGALEVLTQREQEVLRLLVQGMSNKEIASELSYSVGTVKNVVQRVIEKLGVSDRTQAAVYAVRAGIGAPPPPGA
jgi:NarL family two-component system response regulator LiaR